MPIVATIDESALAHRQPVRHRVNSAAVWWIGHGVAPTLCVATRSVVHHCIVGELGVWVRCSGQADRLLTGLDLCNRPRETQCVEQNAALHVVENRRQSLQSPVRLQVGHHKAWHNVAADRAVGGDPQLR